jgi:proteasome alpha subunit
MQGPDQQAYDRGTSIFSPDGRLYQVEYAREAVKRGTPVVGVAVADGVVLVADGRLRSNLQVPESIEKIHKVDDHVGVASAGHAADARQLIDFARRQAQIERLRYNEPIALETLTKSVTDHVQQYTQVGGARPYGAALLFAGVSDGEAHVFETDPSGTPYEWKAVAIGAKSREIQDYLEEHYNPEADLDAAFDLALEGLAETDDDGLDPKGMSAAMIDVESGTYRRLTDEELHEAIVDAGLLKESEE